MRRSLALLTVFAVVTPAAALAARRDPNDGTLSVRDGRGTFMVSARGGIIGSFAHGRVIITDPIDGDGTGPIVSGVDWHRDRSDTTTVYGGTRVRFRLIGGTFRIRVIGTGVNLSVVGRGSVTITGLGTLDDGTYSVNGGPEVGVPFLPEQFALNASSP
jgi:hypothetical protein